MFFIYCFAGWIWESGYVSVKKRKWVNRGFLHGPVIPIYGFGAIVVLVLTIPVKESLALVYLIGMIGATILEYVTGDVMERIFHVRYWDYSNQPLNLNGHICLACSLGWGAFSLAMIKYIHPPVEHLVCGVPGWILEWISLVLVITFTLDTVASVKEALNIKEMLENFAESNETINRIKDRVDDMLEEFDEHKEDAERFFNEITNFKKHAKVLSEKRDRDYRRAVAFLERHPSAISRSHSLEFEKIKEMGRKQLLIARKLKRRIRAYKPEDLEQIMKLWLDSNLEAHDFIDKSYWEAHYEDVRQAVAQSEILVCEEKGRIVGFAGVRDNCLEGLFVSADRRGEGIGKQLLERCKVKYPKLELNVYEKNAQALRFYKKQGFQIIAEQVEEETGEKEYRMRTILAKFLDGWAQ